MNRKQLFVILATATILVTGTAVGGEIYRYTDEEGNVHYGDRPTGAQSEERLTIASRRTDPAAAQAHAAQRYARNDTASQQDADPASPEDGEQEEELSRADRVAAARQREQTCEQYRARLDTFSNSRRLYREGEDGEREYLDDSESFEAQQQVQELIDEYCD